MKNQLVYNYKLRHAVKVSVTYCIFAICLSY